jgi:hypothetical protein
MFTNTRDTTLGMLILRHLHEGDVIDYPVDSDIPQAYIFRALETSGYIERWHRIWPLHDRYRITPQGLAALQKVYQPESAQATLAQLGAQAQNPYARRQLIQGRGVDPALWGALHDPHTHWMTFHQYPGPYHRYLYADRYERRYERRREVEEVEDFWFDDGASELPSPFESAERAEVFNLDTAAGSEGHEPATADLS